MLAVTGVWHRAKKWSNLGIQIEKTLTSLDVPRICSRAASLGVWARLEPVIFKPGVVAGGCASTTGGGTSAGSTRKDGGVAQLIETK